MHTDDDTPTDPSNTPFTWIGGEERVKALTERFYDLMDLEPGYTALRAAHGPDLSNARACFGSCAAGWAARSTTPSSLVTRVCACATCRLPLAFLSVTSGWRAWTKPWQKPMCPLTCANA